MDTTMVKLLYSCDMMTTKHIFTYGQYKVIILLILSEKSRRTNCPEFKFQKAMRN